MTVLRVRASLCAAALLPVSSCLWAQQWEPLGERVCLWQHWWLNTVWLMVQAAVSLSGLLSPDSPVKILFYHCLLCRSHMVRVKVRLTTAAPLDTLWVLLLLRRNTLPRNCVARFLTRKSRDFLTKTFSMGRVHHFCNLHFVLLSSTLSLLPFAFALFSLVACKSLSRMMVTVWPLKSSLVQVQLVQTSLYRRQGPTCHTSFFRLRLLTVQWVITASFSHKIKKFSSLFL